MIGTYFSFLVSGAALAAGSLASEFPVEERALVRATSAFFEAVESPDKTASYDFFSEAYAAAVPLTEWQDKQLRQLVANGPLKDLTAYRITWYPLDELMGAVDFVGSDQDSNALVCGYVLWEFSEETEPRLRWYEATHLDPVQLEKMSAEDASAKLLEANCAFTDLDANFSLSQN
jgi:hypothetical protein